MKVVCVGIVRKSRRLGLGVRRKIFRSRSAMAWTTVCTTCLRLFMIALRTVAMALLNKEKNVTVETHLQRSDHFVIIRARV